MSRKRLAARCITEWFSRAFSEQRQRQADAARSRAEVQDHRGGPEIHQNPDAGHRSRQRAVRRLQGLDKHTEELRRGQHLHTESPADSHAVSAAPARRAGRIRISLSFHNHPRVTVVCVLFGFQEQRVVPARVQRKVKSRRHRAERRRRLVRDDLRHDRAAGRELRENREDRQQRERHTRPVFGPVGDDQLHAALRHRKPAAPR